MIECNSKRAFLHRRPDYIGGHDGKHTSDIYGFLHVHVNITYTEEHKEEIEVFIKAYEKLVEIQERTKNSDE